MMSRPDKVQVVMDWLGDQATEQDAERVLDALEMNGYEIIEEPGQRPTLRPSMDEAEWWRFVEDVLGLPG